MDASRHIDVCLHQMHTDPQHLTRYTYFDIAQLRKISEIDKHIGMVYSGMGPDSRVLVSKARKIAQRYMLTYGEPIPTNQLVREIASVMQEFTQSGGVRPFGVSLIVIGSDDKGPTMYQVSTHCLHANFL